MTEKAEAFLEAALALDPAERRWLAEALLGSLCEDEETLKIAGVRWKSLDGNPDSWVNNEDVIRLVMERKAQVERGEARMVPGTRPCANSTDDACVS